MSPDPRLIALINVAPIAREAVERHQREVLDQYEPTLTTFSTDAHRQAIADNNALNDAAAEALDRVALFPAATVADLHAKLSFMVKHDMGDGVDWLTELLADAERLAGKGVEA
jgi:hypothetical protein